MVVNSPTPPRVAPHVPTLYITHDSTHLITCRITHGITLCPMHAIPLCGLRVHTSCLSDKVIHRLPLSKRYSLPLQCRHSTVGLMHWHQQLPTT